jgi:hypothetical protein
MINVKVAVNVVANVVNKVHAQDSLPVLPALPVNFYR